VSATGDQGGRDSTTGCVIAGVLILAGLVVLAMITVGIAAAVHYGIL
jgi:hypothetical protein